MKVFHEMFAPRPDVGDVRRIGGDPIEHVQIDLDVGLVGDGRDVQGGVGGTSQRHVHSDSILKGVLCQDLRGGEVFLDHGHNTFAALEGDALLFRETGQGCGTVGQGKTEGLRNAGHGIGRVHPLARTRSRAGLQGQTLELFLVYLPSLVPSHSFEGVPHQGTALTFVHTRVHGTGGHHYGGYVQAGCRHEHTGADLVAVGEQDDAVKSVTHGNRFHQVRYPLPGGQAVFHSFVTHDDTVTHARDPHKEGEATACVDTFFDGPFQLPHPNMARYDVGKARENPYVGPLEGRGSHARGVKKGTGRHPFRSLLDTIASHLLAHGNFLLLIGLREFFPFK